MRATHKQMHDQLKALQQQPILDLNALHDMHQKAEEQSHQLREQTSAAWLNFYNGLNDKQKTIVSTALKQRWAKMEARHEKMREHWEHHRAQRRPRLLTSKRNAAHARPARYVGAGRANKNATEETSVAFLFLRERRKAGMASSPARSLDHSTN